MQATPVSFLKTLRLRLRLIAVCRPLWDGGVAAVGVLGSSFECYALSLLLHPTAGISEGDPAGTNVGLRPTLARDACARTGRLRRPMRVKAHYAGRASADDGVQRGPLRRWGWIGALFEQEK